MFEQPLLFAKNDASVRWSLHTTMNLDVLYQATIMTMQGAGHSGKYDQKQYAHALEMPRDQIAFFYNQDTPVTVSRANSANIPLVRTSEYRYPVAAKDQTMHAKISLVYFGDDTYRMAVYSKNCTYAEENCLEVATMFDLLEGTTDIHRKNAEELNDFFGKLKAETTETGEKWLEKVPKFASIKLVSCMEKEVEYEIYFGGCGNGTLYEKMDFYDVNLKESLVITPPVFIPEKGEIQKYFMKNPILYDAKDGYVSHAKLYLLQQKNAYSLWMGSANCTARGIGWNENAYNNSIECLLKKSLNEAEFGGWKESIEELYKPFDFTLDKGSLQKKTPDQIGDFFAKSCCVTKISYEKNGIQQNIPSKKDVITQIVYTMKYQGNLLADLQNGVEFDFMPLEYLSKKVDCVVNIKEKTIVIAYPLGKEFRPSQRMIAVGTSGAMLQIPMGILGDVPTPKGDVNLCHDVYISNILSMSSEDIKNYLDRCIGQLEQGKSGDMYENCLQTLKVLRDENWEVGE